MRLRIALSLLLCSLSNLAMSQTPNICDSVLTPTVFNIGETKNAESFASNFRDEMCRTEWSSQSDAEKRAKGFNLSFSDLTRSLGLGASNYSEKSSLKQQYEAFCQKSVQDIAFSSSFFNRYRSSDFAVAQWGGCIKSVGEGHFALVVPDESLTGATIRLTKRSSGAVPPLKINSIQAGGAYDVSCYYNSQLATIANYPEEQREIAISCIKRADVPANFIINTNWGTFDPIYIPGYSKSISALQSDIAETRVGLQGDLAKTRSALEDLKSKALKRCKVCFIETEGSAQCQQSRNTCSDWASVGQNDPKWTDVFRDDTDNRPGGCFYQWRLLCE